MPNESEIVKKVNEEYSKVMLEISGKMEILADHIMDIVTDNITDISLEDFEKCMLIAFLTLDMADALSEIN